MPSPSSFIIPTFYLSSLIFILLTLVASFPNSSFSISPPNSRFSLEDARSLENTDGVENDFSETTTRHLEFELDSSTAFSEETVASTAAEVCDCGVRGTRQSYADLESDLEGILEPSTPGGYPELFILNGTNTFRGEFPWLAALTRYSEIFSPKVICGASLISDRLLLTAAHCISKRKGQLRVVFNAWKISPFHDVRKDERAMIVKIKRLIPHPKYNSDTVDNDIGLIELEEPVDLLKMRGTIRPVCLPVNKENDYADVTAQVAGWGYTFPSGIRNSPVLLKAQVPIWSLAKCRQTSYGKQILSGMMCAGYPAGGTDACTNDSGGPLIVEEDTRNILVGIVSWGHSCGLPRLPGVYTRLTSHLDWIHEQARTVNSSVCMRDMKS